MSCYESLISFHFNLSILFFSFLPLIRCTYFVLYRCQSAISRLSVWSAIKIRSFHCYSLPVTRITNSFRHFSCSFALIWMQIAIIEFVSIHSKANWKPILKWWASSFEYQIPTRYSFSIWTFTNSLELQISWIPNNVTFSSQTLSENSQKWNHRPFIDCLIPGIFSIEHHTLHEFSLLFRMNTNFFR